MKAKPFVKWAGGKTQLINKITEFLPEEIKNGKIDTYIEPFVGGGALLFYILQNYKIKKAYINDVNKELINCFLCIKEDVQNVINSLKQLETDYFNSDNRDEFYLKVRQEYNEIKLKKELDFKKCSEFIFLNKTCFNGLYRVNKKGLFNVPHGKYKNPLICDEKNLILCAELLQKVKISFGHYNTVIKHTDDKTLIYFDPPYRPLIKNQSFVSYSEFGFDDTDQEILADNFKKLSQNNSFVLLTNSDPKNVDENDNFFDDLYKDFNINRIKAKRSINSNGDKRGEIFELLIKNY